MKKGATKRLSIEEKIAKQLTGLQRLVSEWYKEGGVKLDPDNDGIQWYASATFGYMNTDAHPRIYRDISSVTLYSRDGDGYVDIASDTYNKEFMLERLDRR